MLGFLGGGLSAIGGTAISGLQTAFNFLQTAFRFLLGVLSGFSGALLRISALLTGAVVGAITSFAGALALAVKSSVDYSRALIDLRNQSGMSLKQSRDVTGRFGAFGFEASDIGAMFGEVHHSIASLRARMWGVGDISSPLQINARSQAFGNDFMGHTMKNSFLSSLGLNTSQGRWLANLPTEKVREQANWQQGISARMGIDPDVIRAFAEDLPLLTQRFETFRNLLMIKVGSVALPYLTSAFEKVSAFLTARGPQIGELLGRAVEWAMSSLSQLGEYLIQNGPRISEMILGALEFLWARLPHLILNGAEQILDAFDWLRKGFFSIAHTVVNFLRVLENGNSGFGEFVSGFVQVIDFISVGVNGAGRAFARLGAFLYDFISGLSEIGALIPNIMLGIMKPVVNALNTVGTSILESLGLTDIANSLRSVNDAFQGFQVPTVRSLTGVGFINPMDADADANDLLPTTDLFGQWQNLQNSGNMGKWADQADAALNAGESWSDQQSDAIRAFITAQRANLRSEDERRAEFQSFISELQKGNQIAARIEDNTKQTAANMGGFGQRTIERVLAYITEDAYLANAS